MTHLLLPKASPVLSAEHHRVLSIRGKERRGADTLPPSLSVPEWIEFMDPAITETRHGGVSRFSIEKAADNTYAEAAALSCAVFNALPEIHRKAASEQMEPEQFVVRDLCLSAGRFRGYWWGYSLYCNHCLCADIAFGEAGVAAIAGAIGAVVGGVPGIVLGAVAGFLAIEAGWLAWADAHCNNTGAFINGTWLSVGTPWIKTTC
jgi:hypothetical protein